MKKETNSTLNASKPHSVAEYIAGFPKKTQVLLKQMRKTIRQAAPEAEEVISYGMPGYKYHGMLVYFAGYAKHIGFYGTPSAHKAFQKELSGYKQGKGSVQFPLDKPLPLDLVSRMVTLKLKENALKKLIKNK